MAASSLKNSTLPISGLQRNILIELGSLCEKVQNEDVAWGKPNVALGGKVAWQLIWIPQLLQILKNFEFWRNQRLACKVLLASQNAIPSYLFRLTYTLCPKYTNTV